MSLLSWPHHRGVESGGRSLEGTTTHWRPRWAGRRPFHTRRRSAKNASRGQAARSGSCASGGSPRTMLEVPSNFANKRHELLDGLAHRAVGLDLVALMVQLRQLLLDDCGLLGKNRRVRVRARSTGTRGVAGARPSSVKVSSHSVPYGPGGPGGGPEGGGPGGPEGGPPGGGGPPGAGGAAPGGGVIPMDSAQVLGSIGGGISGSTVAAP